MYIHIYKYAYIINNMYIRERELHDKCNEWDWQTLIIPCGPVVKKIT